MSFTLKKSVFIGLAISVSLVSLIRLLSYLDFTFSTPFDQQAWLYADKTGGGPRLAMVKDLFKKHRFTGKTKEDVAALLGSPENYADLDKDEFRYNIFIDYSMMEVAESKDLVFKLDLSTGKVRECGIFNYSRGSEQRYEIIQ